ncbi:MAG TPA: DUF4139 domain-containing protein [Bacteroidales bacterium]|nr:DUF4139 domain-containing protein [Bacteroidales bacterium]
MKRLAFVSLFLFIAAAASAQAEKEIKAEIKHVTVFPDRAQVDHEGQVSILPGKSTLLLRGLSPYIDPQSIQVKGFGEFTILSVNLQNNFLQNLEDDPEVKGIRKQMEELQLKVEDEKAAISVLKEKSAFLIANRPVLVKETPVSAETFRTIMELYTTSTEQVTMATLKKERLIKEYEKQITALQQQVSARMAKQQLPSGEIAVAISSEKQLTGRLLVNYIVSNAGWYPSYDIRVDNIKNPVGISYKANVFQNTGNAWKDVKLSLSNATPQVSGDMPVLYPWFVDFFNPPVAVFRNRAAKNFENAPSAAMKEEAVVTADEVSAALPEVVVTTGTTTVTFDISVPYTIPSDGQFQTVEIQNLTAPAQYKYLTIPKKSRYAYLTANITDWAGLNLQSGEATLYFENSFVGKSNLQVNQLSDTLTISLGNDNSILVKREKRQDFTSRRTLGSNKTETYSFLITIRNNKPVPVTITVKDQIPVSSNNAISVDPVELTGGKLNSQTGEVSWDLEVKPSETKQLVLTYSVKYPKDKTVVLE